jgi:hypothetical protein
VARLHNEPVSSSAADTQRVMKGAWRVLLVRRCRGPPTIRFCLIAVYGQPIDSAPVVTNKKMLPKVCIAWLGVAVDP